MGKRKKLNKLISILIIILIPLIPFLTWQNNDIVVSYYDYFNNLIPEDFNNFKILQVSDLHNKEFGNHQVRLLNEIIDFSPDIIIITGDIIDRTSSDINNAITFIKGAIDIAPIYYVSGNHENDSSLYKELLNKLKFYGVYILNNKTISIQIKKSTINLIGMSDPTFSNSDYNLFSKKLKTLVQTDKFNILLSHRPELMNIYVENKIDLVFTGHAHGGQIRFPFIGGIFSPHQGFFPIYTAGKYETNKTSMYVSRGLGNSIFPVRLFNRPEIVALRLHN